MPNHNLGIHYQTSHQLPINHKNIHSQHHPLGQRPHFIPDLLLPHQQSTFSFPSSRTSPSRFPSPRNRSPLLTQWSSYGHVPCRKLSQHHQTNRPLVKRRIYGLHQTTNSTIFSQHKPIYAHKPTVHLPTHSTLTILGHTSGSKSSPNWPSAPDDMPSTVPASRRRWQITNRWPGCQGLSSSKI
jgi:hypothetical protein